jgi:protein-tyrosine kinase
MSMIEQASKRLEQLGQAGYTVPASVSRLRVVDDADGQAARRRLNAPARPLGDAAESKAASVADDAPAHFSPALYPSSTPELAGAVARQTGSPDLPLVAAGAESFAAAPAVAAELAHPVNAWHTPTRAGAPYFAPIADAAKRLPDVPDAPAPWFDETPTVAPTEVPASPPTSVALPVLSASVPTAAIVPTAPPLPSPAPAPAQVAAAAPHAHAVGAAIDVSMTQRAEPSTRVSFDLERLRGAGYLVPDQVRSEMAEQFRHLKRPLLKNARAKTGPAGLCGSHIMITSALPGEGKTFSSINLAMSMAMEVDTAVLLIDADVVRPSIFNRLGINIQPPGLLDLLTRDDLPLHEALVSTNVPKLTLMASGERNQRSTELLASTAMDKLLARLAEEYPDHVVIFDAPPLLLTNESPVLATKVGQVVVVVEASKTRRTVVQQAFAALKNCPVVHSVLNKCDEAAEGRRYGYYYG